MRSEIVRRLEPEVYGKGPSPASIWTRRMVRVLIALIVPLLLAEIALRIGGYYRPQIAMSRQAQTQQQAARALNERFNTSAFTPDRYLLWRLDPGTNLAGLDVSGDGLLGMPAADARTDPTTTRVLVLGDSTSAVTYRPWPRVAERLVNAAGSRPIVQFINAAVPGYTSEQALRRLPQLRKFNPDFVFISLGWSDRFPALNLPDKELGARSAFHALLHRLFYRSRVYQALAAPAGPHRVPDSSASGSLRVSPDEFEANVRALVKLARDAGGTPVLMTQPALFTTSSTEFLVQEDFLTSGVEPAQLHSAYNRVLRRVAADTNTPIVDVDEEFERRDKQPLFEPDGIHLSGPGHNLAARLAINGLKNQGVLSPAQFDDIVQRARFDTSAPDKPRAAWTVNRQILQVDPSTSASVSLIASNTGNTTWLRAPAVRRFGNETNVRFGSVSVVARWRTEGAPTTGTAAEARLGHDLLPGESTSQTLTLQTPATPGAYELEIGLTAERVGELVAFGAETTTVTVVVK